MTESQQSKRGWLRGWRENRAAKRQDLLERRHFEGEQAGESGGIYRRSSAYQHSGTAAYFGSGFGGGDGGGCGGDGGGGGC